MGRGRYIYINDDIDQSLQKELNKSKLVNDLLREYFEKRDFLNVDVKQLKIELEVKKIEKATQLKIEAMRSGK